MPRKADTLCKTKRCTNKKKGGNFCHKCIKRKWRENNPVKSAYANLVCNSKRRGILCTISFEYFSKLCIKTDYIQGKGKTSESYSLDRKKEDLGYVEGNIRVITLSANTKKEHKRRKKVLRYDYQTKTGSYVEIKNIENSPF